MVAGRRRRHDRRDRLEPRSAGRRHQAPSLRRGGRRRRRPGDDAARRAPPRSMPATSTSSPCSARSPPGRRNSSASRSGAWRRARRPTSSSSIPTCPGSATPSAPLAIQEHALRGRPLPGPGAPHAGCRPHGLSIPSLTGGSVEAGARRAEAGARDVDLPVWASAGLALAVGYLLGSIPFGVVFTRFAGVGDVRTARS